MLIKFNKGVGRGKEEQEKEFSKEKPRFLLSYYFYTKL